MIENKSLIIKDSGCELQKPINRLNFEEQSRKVVNDQVCE